MGRTFKITFRVALVLAALYLCFIYWLYNYQRDIMYLPPDAINPSIAGNLTGFEEVVVTTADGIDLTGFYIRPMRDDAPMMIVFHGNADHPSYMATRFRNMARYFGMGVLLAEYRGYSGHAGTPSQDGLLLDGDAFIAWWRAQDSSNKHKLILYGESLGSGVAAQLAASHVPDAVIMVSPFDSALAVAKNHYPYVPYMDLLLQDQWRSDEALAKSNIPKLILAGDKDQTVPVQHSKALFDAALPPKMITTYSEAGHINVFKFGALEEMGEFMDMVYPEKAAQRKRSRPAPPAELPTGKETRIETKPAE